MKISIIGCGRWGSVLAWYLSSRLGHEVLVQGREGSASFSQLRETRKNEYVELPESVGFTASLAEAMEFSDTVVVSINAQGFPALLSDIRALYTCGAVSGRLNSKTFILCMKGLLEGSGRRLSEELHCTLGEDVGCIAWVGPGHPQDFCAGIPNCMILASDNVSLAAKYSELFSSELIRLYFSGDAVAAR